MKSAEFTSMAVATSATIGTSVATVVIAKWSGTFDRKVAERRYHASAALGAFSRRDGREARLRR